MLKVTDWYTDDLFQSDEHEMIKANFSRIFCDPERFADDSQEIMAQYGMGVLYEKNDDGELMRVVTPELRKRILKDYYWPHHAKLNNAVNKQLQLYAKALILDCHSYPRKPFKRDLDKSSNRPDFNIGTDDFHTPATLIEASKDYFENAVAGSNVMIIDATKNIIHVNNKKLVLVQGLDDFIVVDTEDVLLICKKDKEQAIKEYVAEVKRNKGEKYL